MKHLWKILIATVVTLVLAIIPIVTLAGASNDGDATTTRTPRSRKQGGKMTEKTTIRNLDRELFKQARIQALKDGKTLGAWVNEAIASYLKKAK
ncbi:MAG: hypothetical protein CEN89_639 [Candidatus Berkelbacteria bacterium Licking1014_7]|uniref:Uncharacterized protein n=1 Tax=Candidatus Berkelbacteria bacterium Licking1014_7 TaxID=2017147 RepID=A0A554LI11_9BACT|nr:MAG: hypothetical protein CEN89_639 [Candidatus Berkelbacteria bacterium Licking1014_7]